MNFCATEVNQLRDMAPWSLSSAAKSYVSPDIFNSFDNFVDNFLPTPIHASIMPHTSLKSTIDGDFRYNSGDSWVTSTVDVEVTDAESANMGTNVPESMSCLIDCLRGSSSDDGSSNGASISPDTLVYGSGQVIDSNIAQAAPILNRMLNKPVTDLRMNSQDYRHNLDPAPMNPPKSSPTQFQQPSQFQSPCQQFSQHFSQSQPYYFQRGNQIQCENQLPYQPKYPHYSPGANYFNMMTTYQATNKQEIGWQMGQMRPPMASQPPVMSVSPYPTTSPPAQISSTDGSLVVKRANSRAKDNKWLPVKKYDNGIYHHCPVCDRPFKNRSNIKTHLRTHTKEKPYSCDVCKKAFCQKAHLTKHTVIHQRDRISGK